MNNYESNTPWKERSEKHLLWVQMEEQQHAEEDLQKEPVLASFETIDSGLKVGSSHYEVKVERIRSIKDKRCWSSFCSTPERGTRSCGHTSREIETKLPM